MSKLTMHPIGMRVLHSLFWLVMMGVFLIATVYSAHQTMMIATVNITGMVNGFVKETAQQHLTMELKQQKVNQFGQSMQHVMVEMAKRHHIVIMPSETVIAGSIDYTQEVMAEIKKEMKT